MPPYSFLTMASSACATCSLCCSFSAHHNDTLVMYGGVLPFRLRMLMETVYGDSNINEAVWLQHYREHNQRVVEVWSAGLVTMERLIAIVAAGDSGGAAACAGPVPWRWMAAAVRVSGSHGWALLECIGCVSDGQHAKAAPAALGGACRNGDTRTRRFATANADCVIVNPITYACRCDCADVLQAPARASSRMCRCWPTHQAQHTATIC